ncbi:MAG: two-component system sensor histidine kinase ChvG [Granulosicoccus sp.]|jgi:two-component system sensor histidine kinase ChvG
MKLRSQMLLAGALTLAVPIVGLQSVKQLYSALQKTRIDEQTLKVANMRLALSDEESVNAALTTGLASAGAKDWYAQSSPYPMFVDGYADDWQELNDQAFRYETKDSVASVSVNNHDLRADVRVAKSSDNLFMYLTVTDDVVIYHLPPTMRPDVGEGELPNRQARLVNGDSIEILAQDNQGAWKHTLFRPIAPGTMAGLRALGSNGGRGYFDVAEQPMPGWVGAWVSTQNGYHVEIKIPLPPSGTPIGLAIVDVDYSGEDRSSWVGTLSPERMTKISTSNATLESVPGGIIFHDSPLTHQYLKRWTSPGVRARLFDVHGRLMADIDNLYEKYDSSDEAFASAETSEGLWDAILLRIFAFFVAGDLPLLPESRNTPVTLILSDERRATVVGDAPITSRYVTDENDRVLGTLAPIGSKPRRGYLLFEANEEHASAYAGSEMARLYSLLLLVSLLAGSGLLIFAFVLSSRIRRLSQEAQHAIADDGRVHGLPGSDARDEIGDLSRKLSTLLARSAAYTQYLEALASRLSHELRTPLSVVRTSLENLDREQLDSQSLQLVDRASDGADHLGSIIKALVESTRLEQSVQLADKQSIDLVEWISGSLLRYRQVYPETDLRLSTVPASAVNVTASPELLQQAFDKLVDNAVGFVEKGPVFLHLTINKQSVPHRASLGVANLGERVPADAMAQWFDPMFSDRQAGGRELHLGLGLYIVKMIAESHNGSAFARHQRTTDRQQWIHVGLRLPMI